MDNYQNFDGFISSGMSDYMDSDYSDDDRFVSASKQTEDAFQ